MSSRSRSRSTFFYWLSLLLLFSTEAQARGFPDELMVLNIGGGRISNPPPPSLTASSIFEMMSDTIRWIVSSSAAPTPLITSPTGQQQVVDQINCHGDEIAKMSASVRPCCLLNDDGLAFSSSHLFSPAPPLHQSVLPPPKMPPSPCIPCPPHDHLRLHPAPMTPSPYIPPPIHENIAHPSPFIPPPIVSEMMINGISRGTPISMITHPQSDHLQVS
ncbi:hypothetical protein V6N13_144347 [Hibiscus sabdariffa]|uniref:Uncharacterized protein n=1 Tax=Hibiscus sabdariffa TaxID=183260 RepID=A0ABR2FK95_9ROSI